MKQNLPDGCFRFLDMWAIPEIHPTNLKLFQNLKTADSQQFTHNMQAVGTVSECDASDTWDKSHLVGLRSDIWKPDQAAQAKQLAQLKKKRRLELRSEFKGSGRLDAKKTRELESQLAADKVMNVEPSEIISQRLVLKLFQTTTKRMRWCGTIEEVTSTEIHNSIASGTSLITMAVTLPGSKIITSIEQNHCTARIPSIFSFFYLHKHTSYQLVLKRHWLSIGANYDLLCEKKTLGEIDGSVVCVGSESYLKLGNHELSEHVPFQNLLTLFAASVGYHKAMRASLQKRVQANLAGEEILSVTDPEEMRLHDNGRRTG